VPLILFVRVAPFILLSAKLRKCSDQSKEALPPTLLLHHRDELPRILPGQEVWCLLQRPVLEGVWWPGTSSQQYHIREGSRAPYGRYLAPPQLLLNYSMGIKTFDNSRLLRINYPQSCGHDAFPKYFSFPLQIDQQLKLAQQGSSVDWLRAQICIPQPGWAMHTCGASNREDKGGDTRATPPKTPSEGIIKWRRQITLA